MAWNIIRRKKRDMPDGLWIRCEDCSRMVYKKEVEEGLQVCPKCNFHFRITARDRLRILLDEDSFEEFYEEVIPGDPLKFVDREPYPDRIKRYQAKTGLKDAIIAGRGTIEGVPLLIAVTDYFFMAGCMGSVVGEKITRIAEDAVKMNLPLVIVAASGGGARMQEGVLSLMQMAKTSAAIGKMREAGVLYISVLTDPTMGGAMASFASLGDVVLAEPKALIGFTGPDVMKETIGATLPEGFQRTEFALEHGLIDRIVDRKDMRRTLKQLMDLCMPAEDPTGSEQ
jgi:acetyl-CoA carboxylase carboxyl transferase subunit beta